MILSLEFQEAYKRLDKLCRDCFASNEGVSEYIHLMENESLCGGRYVQFWESDYKELKHVRWVRNQLSHEVGTLQSDICTQEDLAFVVDFYQRIMSGDDPLTKLRQAKSIAKTQFIW
ncbi:MAG TPA: hypothetical protein DDY77_03480 [Clostridiales bacterium]|nr:hypothetical protein [Clostridiales bacterium]